MNKVIFLVLLMPAMAFGQVVEDFEQGNLSGWVQNPEGHWDADDSNSISGILSLHHSFDNPVSGTDRIGMTLSDLHPGEGPVRWRFGIRYGCDPSSSNNWAVFLMSDTDPASFESSPAVNGFAVGVNQAGYDDTLRLWKIRDGTYFPVAGSGLNWQTDIGTANSITITVERSQSGQWTIDASGSDNRVAGSDSGFDPDLFDPGWFILQYRYTSTRDQLLWFDDITIEGVFYEDVTPPAVTRCEVNGSGSVLLSFTEAISDQSFSISNFLLDNGNNPVSDVIQINSRSAIIKFEKEFSNLSENKLIIMNLCDRQGNCKNNTLTGFTFARAVPGDLIISEIMADPLPAISLPGKEYLELTNRTGFSINMKNWFLTDGNQRYFFPSKEIAPGAATIICSIADTILFRDFGSVIGLKSFPALTDAGKILALNDSTGNLIHGVRYSSAWYGDQLKSGGGWSLEMIDPEYPFFEEGNWQASSSKKGGTPGTQNAVSRNNPDIIFTGIANVFPDDSVTVRLKLSETVFAFSEKSENVKIGDIQVRDIFRSDPLSREFIVIPEQPLESGEIYTVSTGDEIKDFAGNIAERGEYSFGIPSKPGKHDILFNELLFNPTYGDADYIEFYNDSRIIADAAQLILVSVNDEKKDTSEIFKPASEGRCILPGEYFAITADRKSVLERYFSSDPFCVFEVPDLPSMPDDKGHLILMNRELDLIDEVFYDEKMQYSLLQDEEGVSLEKVRPGGLSADRAYWHSASETSGWGTPGAPNSVLSEKPEGNDRVKLSSTRVTPDNDGIDDLLVVDMNLAGNGNVVSILLFDETGSIVKKLTDNFLAGQAASITWDGTDSGGRIVSNGIYILLVAVFDDTGKIEKWKKICTVVR